MTSGEGRPRVVLVGPPGAGKTVVGRELAERWQLPFLDSDAVVEERAGKPVSDIFVDDGEAAFRALEQDAVADLLASAGAVVSLGGGAVLAAETRDRLNGHSVAFLDVSLAAAAQRVGMNTSRPLLLGNVRSQLKALLDARHPLYEQVATWRVETDQLGVEQVADEVERLTAGDGSP
jgi:shikimate kinase